MAYFELVIAINEPVVEIMSDFLLECGFTGVITENNFINRENDFGVIKAYASKNDLKMTKNELKTLIFDKKKALFECGFSENHTGSFEFSLNLIEDESWAENWKKYWDVQKIGNRTVICPSWLEYEPKDGEFKITLDPGCAFGTGTHPTTRLCVRALEEYVFEDCTLADIGCGSGILAIEGKLLGAGDVIGVDIDEDSIVVSNENAHINNVVCDFSVGTIKDVQHSYDVVVANILANVIVDIMPDLKRITKPDGVVILSGIIEEKAQDVKNAMEKSGIVLVSETIEAGNGENWVCLVGKISA